MSSETVPAWLVAKVDQRLALMDEFLRQLEFNHELIMTPLDEPPEGASEAQFRKWDRTCDNCGRYCKGRFYTGNVVRELHGKQVVITFGVCPRCKEAT